MASYIWNKLSFLHNSIVRPVTQFIIHKIKQFLLSLYIKLDNKASNATLITLVRLTGSVLTYSNSLEPITVPTLSSSGIDVKLAGKDQSYTNVASYYPNFLPPTLVPKYDFVDYIFSCMICPSKILGSVFSLLYNPWIPRYWAIFVCQKVLKYLFMWKKDSTNLNVLGFVLVRTAVADAFLRWSILYGGNPILAVKPKAAESEDMHPNIPAYTRKVYDNIYLHMPIYNFENFELPELEYHGVHQILIIGAGFDNRAYKFSHLRQEMARMALRKQLNGSQPRGYGNFDKQNLKCSDNFHYNNSFSSNVNNMASKSSIAVYEIDLQQVQERKKKLVLKQLSSMRQEHLLEDVNYITCDLVKDSLFEKLSSSGAKRGVATSILFEGVSYYISKAAFYNVLKALSDFFVTDNFNAAASNFPSTVDSPALNNVFLCFDYTDVKIMEELEECRAQYWLYKTLPTGSNIGCLNSKTIPEELNAAGWCLINDWGPKEVRGVFHNIKNFTQVSTSAGAHFHIVFCQALRGEA